MHRISKTSWSADSVSCFKRRDLLIQGTQGRPGALCLRVPPPRLEPPRRHLHVRSIRCRPLFAQATVYPAHREGRREGREVTGSNLCMLAGGSSRAAIRGGNVGGHAHERKAWKVMRGMRRSPRGGQGSCHPRLSAGTSRLPGIGSRDLGGTQAPHLERHTTGTNWTGPTSSIAAYYWTLVMKLNEHGLGQACGLPLCQPSLVTRAKTADSHGLSSAVSASAGTPDSQLSQRENLGLCRRLVLPVGASASPSTEMCTRRGQVEASMALATRSNQTSRGDDHEATRPIRRQSIMD